MIQCENVTAIIVQQRSVDFDDQTTLASHRRHFLLQWWNISKRKVGENRSKSVKKNSYTFFKN